MDDLKRQVFVLGIMVGLPALLWWLQNVARRSLGLPPEPVGEHFAEVMGAMDGGGHTDLSGADGGSTHGESLSHTALSSDTSNS